METSFFSHLAPQPPDPLLKLIGDFAADPRKEKVDLGVGVYRAADGTTPVLAAVKEAEKRLLAEQKSKSYLGPEGNIGFNRALKELVFGAQSDAVCIQTPGGTGALRLAMDVIARTKANTRVWVGAPTWPNHLALLGAAGLEIVEYRHFDQKTQTLHFEEALAALAKAKPGDVVLLHGCCHNPTGADFSLAQWSSLAEAMASRALLPLIDLAYQGFGESFETDVAGARQVIERCGEALLAYSCDKNFALYRERVGALFAFTREGRVRDAVLSNILSCARSNWSMPPDHGGAIVRTILEDPALTRAWRGELDAMHDRIASMRRALAGAHPDFAPVAGQKGLFSLLPVAPAQVDRLKEKFGIFMPRSGRINVAGLTDANIPRLVDAWRALKAEADIV
ncbi:MAG TPA: amino acid aminotransferase [Rhizomicrobium sp.]|nr:amino acid aminotransferase [Rhizomicrobium sp.]